MSDSHPFQVDLRGIIDLLSRHIYSSPQVYLRELLQNGRDAVRARQLYDPMAPAGRIDVTAQDGTVTFTDNGIGLTLDEATELLATVGRSSKRDEVLGLRRDDFLGQFGIGLLSCFLVSDEIVVHSRSARGGAAIRWIGSADGTFQISTPDSELPIGTRVELRARADDAALARPEQVRRLLRRFGEFLPDTISFEGEQLNRPAPFLSTDPAELAAFGEQVIGTEPLDIVPLDVPGTATRGIAYVLPFAPPPSTRQSHRVYIGQMLLGDRVPDLLPDWAFFVRCVLNTDAISPTASRESLVENEALAYTRDELGLALRHWIVNLAISDPGRFHTFVTVHQLALKSMALHDDELARALLPHIIVETSAGQMAIGDLLHENRTIRYTSTVDEFRQLAAVVPLDDPVVNAGYTLDTEILRRLPQVFAEAMTHQVHAQDVLAQLDPVPLNQTADAVALERRAELALDQIGCQVVTRCFNPTDLSAIFLMDPAALRKLERDSTRKRSAPMWAEVLEQVDQIVTPKALTKPQLCLNWSSPLIADLAGVSDDLVFGRSLRMLYVQALLAGHHPLRARDRQLLSGAMRDLIQLSVLHRD